MGKYKKNCLLCKNSEDKTKNSEISYHRFTRSKELKALWMEVCNLDPRTDVVDNLFICSEHFQESDYSETSGKRILKKTVPSVGIPEKNGNANKSIPAVADNNTLTSPNAKLDPPECLIFNVDVPNEIETSTATATDADDKEPDTILLCETPKKKRKYNPNPRSIGEICTPHLSTPRRRKRTLAMIRSKVDEYRKKIKTLSARNRRLVKKVTNLKEMLQLIKNKGFLSEEAANDILEQTPVSVKGLLERQLKTKKRKYSAEIRTFAITLQFYSAKAYNFVRKAWGNLLPHSSIITKWYSTVDGKPGFSQEAFVALEHRASNLEKPLVVNIVSDEMSIRKSLQYVKGEGFVGGVDLGILNHEKENDNCTMATNVLVFMAVGLNSAFKVALGYFLIKGLDGEKRAKLLKLCLEKLHHIGVKTYSITFDGAASNKTMCENLGAEFEYGEKFQPWFINPCTKEKMFIFFDAVHMLKLVRNTLGDMGTLLHQNKIINWDHIVRLHKFQQQEGLRAGNKLTVRHINFFENKMKVSLAAQTLSGSVGAALRYVEEKQFSGFQNADVTAEFCETINKAFDMLNVRSRFSKKRYGRPLDAQNIGKLKDMAADIKQYILNLCTNDGKPVLFSRRKTGFIGLIICLNNMFDLFEYCSQKGELDFLLTFKLSQDFLENFFCAIRSRGGHNNNPTAKQFESAYKRLIVRHELESVNTGNCMPDGVQLLFASSARKPIQKKQLISEDIKIISRLLQLSPFIENVVEHIAGFVVRSVEKKLSCNVCYSHLENETLLESYPLIGQKKFGKLKIPSKDVVIIVKHAEKLIRYFQEKTNFFKIKNLREIIVNKTFSVVYAVVFNSSTMHEHLLQEDKILDNHKSKLIKNISNSYISLRLFHEASKISQPAIKVRHTLNKQILHRNQ